MEDEKHVSGPDSDGNITKQVSDTTVFINAVFTAEAIDNYNSDDDVCSPPEWDQASLIVKDYSLSFIPAPCLNDCQFSLVIKKFSLLSLHNGSICKSNIHDCMEEPQVQQAARDRWTQWMSQTAKSNTEESETGAGQLSLLLDVVMCPSEMKLPDSTEGQPQPSTSREPATSDEKLTQERMSKVWSRCKTKPFVEDWIICQSQQEILDEIEEWREDYIPPPSLSSEEQSRSESGEVKSSQIEHRVKNKVKDSSLPNLSGDAGSPKKDTALRMQSEGSSLPNISGDAGCSKEEQTAEMTKRRNDTQDKSGETKHSKDRKRGIKCQNKRDNPETAEDSGSSQVKKTKLPEGRVSSPAQPIQEFGDEYLKFLKAADSPKRSEGIKIVEVFTLDNLPTAWHTSSQDSIQFTCPSPPDSDENLVNSESDNSQEACSIHPDDHSPADSSHVPEQHRHPVSTSASCNPQKDVVPTFDKTNTIDAGKTTPVRTTVSKQKCSTPASTQRNRIHSVFDKTIDASCIPRASISSDIMLKSSTGDNVDSVLFVDVEGHQTSDKVSFGEKNAHQGHLPKRVSFAPCVLSKNLEKQGGTQPFDVTDSTHSIYEDAKSHLSCPDSSLHDAPDPDSPEIPPSQPFTPSTEDLLAEDTGTSEVETGAHSRYKHTDSCGSVSVSVVSVTKNTKSDNEIGIEMSFHHSTQASDDVPASRPEFFISPIREISQKQDRVHVYCNNDKLLGQDSVDKSGDSNSAESHQTSVVMETDPFDEEKLKKVSSVSDADLAKSHVDSHCAQHPSFAESGSEEQIPLSSGSDNMKNSDIAQNGKETIDQRVKKLCDNELAVSKNVQNQRKNSLHVKGSKAFGKQKTAHGPVLKVSPPCDENEKGDMQVSDSSDRRCDSVVIIEEYSTDSSGLETKNQSLCSPLEVSEPKDEMYQTEIFSESESEDESLPVEHIPNTQDAIRVVMEVRRMEEEEDEQNASRRRKAASMDSSDSQDISVIMINEEAEFGKETEKDFSDNMSVKSKKNLQKKKKVPEMSSSPRDRDSGDHVKETLTSETQTSPVYNKCCENLRKVELNLKGRKKVPNVCDDELTIEPRRKRCDRETRSFKSATVTSATSDNRSESGNRHVENTDTNSLTPNFAKVKDNFITTRRLHLRKGNKDDHDDSSSRKRFKHSSSVQEKNLQDSEGTTQTLSKRSDSSCQVHGLGVQSYRTISPDTGKRSNKKKTLIDTEEDCCGNKASVSHTNETSKVVDEVEIIEIDRDHSVDRTHCSLRKSDVEKMFAKTMKKFRFGKYSAEKPKEKPSKSVSCGSSHQQKDGGGAKSSDEKDSLNRCSKPESKNTFPNTHKIPSAPYTDVGTSCLSSSIMEEELDSSHSKPTIQTLLDFLDIEAVEDRRLFDCRTSDEMRNKIYKIFSKPISYPEQEKNVENT